MPNFESASPRRGLPLRLSVVVILLLTAGAESFAQLPVIGLRSLSRAVFTPGSSVEVRVAEGTDSGEVDRLLFSHPGLNATLLRDPARPFAASDQPRHGSFEVSVAADTPPGRYEVRAVGRFGVSNPRSILVVPSAEFVSASNSDPTTATPIKPGAIYHRNASPRTRDFFLLPVEKDLQYRIRVISAAIDSQVIGAIAIYDPAGRTLASAHGSDRIDAELSLTAERDGTVLIAISDALFRGGASFPYGLVVNGDSAELDAMQPTVTQSADLRRGDAGESEPTAAEQDDVRLQVPAEIVGSFDSPQDRDQYVFEATKGQPLSLEVVSARLGQPTDVRLTVERAATDPSGAKSWSRVATAEDQLYVTDSVVRFSHPDPKLRFQPPETGEYRVTLSDLDTGQSLGRVQTYRLRAKPPREDWQLIAYPAYPHKDPNATRLRGMSVPRGGATTIRVFVLRSGFAGAIRLSIEGLPEGVECQPGWIAANQNQADLTVTADDDVATHVFPITVKGTSSQGDQTRTADVASVVWEKDAVRATPLVRLVDQIMVQTSEIDVAPLSLRTRPDVIECKKGEKITVPVTVNRGDGGKTNVVLRPKNLPPGVKAAELTIDAAKTEAEWTIDVSANAKPGTYSMWGQGETKVKFAVNPQSLTRAVAYRDHLRALRADPQQAPQHAEIDKAITEADKQVTEIKKSTNPRDFTVYVPTTLITLKISE